MPPTSTTLCFHTKRMALLIHLSFKVSNNRFFFFLFLSFTAKDVSYRTIIQRGKKEVASFSAAFSPCLNALRPVKVQPPLHHHHHPPSVSFTCPCVTVRLQRAPALLWEVSLGLRRVGEDLCPAPHLSVAYLNHAHS